MVAVDGLARRARDWRARRRAQRLAHRALEPAAADGDARLAVAVSRACRRADRRHRELHGAAAPLPRARTRLPRRGPGPGAMAAAGGARVLGRGPSHDARPRVLRDRPQPGGVTARGARRHEAPLRAVCRLGSARRAGGYHLRGAPGSGQGGRGHGLRAHRHHGRRPGRHGDQRRQRHHRRHGDRADGDGGVAERPAARRVAGRTGGRAHGRAAGRRDRRAARGGAAGVASGAGGRRGDAELSARRPVRRHRGQRRASSRAPTGGSCDRFSTASPDRLPRRAALPPQPPLRASSSA